LSIIVDAIKLTPYLYSTIESFLLRGVFNRTEQNRTEQNRTEQNRTEQNRTEQNRTEQNKTKQNKTKQDKKQNYLPIANLLKRTPPPPTQRILFP
jgi:hypothetical protein